MNYYERHLGDYARDTGHLSLLEHGVYTVLLDRIYSTERGIPDDQKYRFSRARTPDECAAVDAVLIEFFVLSEGVWVNQRADDEITKATARITSAIENGRKGGRPRKPEPKEPNPFELETQPKPNPFELETQPKAYQAPSTKHQTPNTSKCVSNETHALREASENGSTPAGDVCRALRDAGVSNVNPAHPALLALVADGVGPGDFDGAVASLQARDPPPSNPFAYVLAVVRGQRKDAQSAPHTPKKSKKQGQSHDRHAVEEPA